MCIIATTPMFLLFVLIYIQHSMAYLLVEFLCHMSNIVQMALLKLRKWCDLNQILLD